MITAENLKRLEIQETQVDGHRTALLFVDGHPVAPQLTTIGSVSVPDPSFAPEQSLIPNGTWIGHILDAELAKEIETYRFSDIGHSIGVLSLPFRTAWSTFISRVYVVRSNVSGSDIYSLGFHMKIWAEDWANPFLVWEYQAALIRVAEDTADFKYEDLRPMLIWPNHDIGSVEERSGTFWEFGFASSARSANHVLGEEIVFWNEKLKEVSAAAARLILKERKDALVTFFEFPPALRTSCEQYLIYFIQFLEDFGIRADSEIIQQAGHVMFSVSPEDGTSALAKVKEALAIYLSLPIDREFTEVADQFSDVAVIQLRANVLFLKSQLELAKAVIQVKDATITALDLTIFQQRQFLPASAEGMSALPPASKTHDEESLLGNTISVIPYEGKGFKINLPHILRQLKRALGVPREKSQIDDGAP